MCVRAWVGVCVGQYAGFYLKMLGFVVFTFLLSVCTFLELMSQVALAMHWVKTGHSKQKQKI